MGTKVALCILIGNADSAIDWDKRKAASCFVRFIVDRIFAPVLEKCVKTVSQECERRERNFWRALLNSTKISRSKWKDLNDMFSYRKP